MSDIKAIEKWEYYKKNLVELELEVFSYEDGKIILKAKDSVPALYLHLNSLEELGTAIKTYSYAQLVHKQE